MHKDIPQEEVARLDNAATEEERLAIERELLEQTANGWQEGDPEEQPAQGVEDKDADR